MVKTARFMAFTWTLLKGFRGKFVILVILSITLNFIAPLIIPNTVQVVFDIFHSTNEGILFNVIMMGTAFLLLLALMAWINIYGDTWATYLYFSQVRKTFEHMYRSSYIGLVRKHSEGDIYNRVNAGCGNSIGGWFSLVDIIL